MKVESGQEYTKEQIEQFKADMKAQMLEEIPMLELKKQHQTLVTELDELYMRSAYAQRKVAEIMAPAPKEAEDAPKAPTQPSVERKLRVEKKETVE